MAEIVVREAVGVEEIGVVRELMRAYGAHLASNPAGAARAGQPLMVTGSTTFIHS